MVFWCRDDVGDEGQPLRSNGEGFQKMVMSISAAPAVDTSGLVLVDSKAMPIGEALPLPPTTSRSIAYNLPAAQMHAPSYGPADPAAASGIPAGSRNHWSGHAEDAHLNSYSFDEQYNSFQARGVATDPGLSLKTVSRPGFEPNAARLLPETKRQRTTAKLHLENPPLDKNIHTHGDLSNLPPFVLRSRQPWAEKESVEEEPLAGSADGKGAEELDKGTDKGVQKPKEPQDSNQTIFHGKEEKDYQGRSWVEAPRDGPPQATSCFLPKRHIHTWSGHTKGVAAIRFFPSTGHLLLSAGLDGKAKIWDVTGGVGKDWNCMRTYLGHSKGVRDAWFSSDGARFVTTAYDKVIKLWDTETGAVLGKFSQGHMAYTVRLHPAAEEPNVLLAGMQNKKIMQFDIRTGDVVQEYDYHLAAVNTVTFVDDNRRFISTSDDKSIRVWEFGIPVQVKCIADPSMHAISTATVTCNGKWWLGQSADNTIVTYSADEKTRPNKRKTFRGHTTAGYACHIHNSNDSRYIISADGDGKLFVWDWKNCKILRSFKAHEGPCVGAAWHPLETSKVATSGWDGLIKYWD